MRLNELLELDNEHSDTERHIPQQYQADTTPPPLPENELVYYRDYVMFESKVLNDIFIFCRDKKNLKHVRKKHPGIPIYFEPEINELWKCREEKESLQWVHRFKKEFGGWIVPSDNQID